MCSVGIPCIDTASQEFVVNDCLYIFPIEQKTLYSSTSEPRSCSLIGNWKTLVTLKMNVFVRNANYKKA